MLAPLASSGGTSGVSSLPLNRWTDFGFHVQPGNSPATAFTLAGGMIVEVLFSIAHLFWVIVDGAVRIADDQKLANTILAPGDWVLAEIGRQQMVWIIMLLFLIIGLAAAMFRWHQGQQGHAIRKALRTFIPFLVAVAMLGGARADYQAAGGKLTLTKTIAHPAVMSPGWIADEITNITGSLSGYVPIAVSNLLTNSDGPQPNCSSFLTQLYSNVGKGNPNLSLDISASQLFVVSFVQPFELAQFGPAAPNGSPVAYRMGCRYLDDISTSPAVTPAADAQLQNGADQAQGVSSIGPASPNLFEQWADTDQQTADLTFWATCAYYNGGWHGAPGLGASPNTIGGFSPNQDCPKAWRDGLYSQPGTLGGNGQDFQWATSGQTISRIQNNSAKNAPMAAAWALDYNGQGWDAGAVLGFGAILGGLAAAALFIFVGVSLLLGLGVLEVILCLAPFLLVWAMSPADHAHSKVWALFAKSTVGAIIGVTVFSLIAAVAAVFTMVIDAVIMGVLGGIPAVAGLFVGMAPAFVLLVLNHVSKRLGFGSISHPGHLISRVGTRIEGVTASIGNPESGGFVNDMRQNWRSHLFPEAYRSKSARRADTIRGASSRTNKGDMDQAMRRMGRLGGKDEMPEEHKSTVGGIVRDATIRAHGLERKLPTKKAELLKHATELALGPEDVALMAAAHWGKDVVKRGAHGLELKDGLTSEHHRTLARSMNDPKRARELIAQGKAAVDPSVPEPSSRGMRLARQAFHGMPRSTAELTSWMGNHLSKDKSVRSLMHHAVMGAAVDDPGRIARIGHRLSGAVTNGEVADALRLAADRAAKDKSLEPPTAQTKRAFANAKDVPAVLATARRLGVNEAQVKEARRSAGLDWDMAPQQMDRFATPQKTEKLRQALAEHARVAALARPKDGPASFFSREAKTNYELLAAAKTAGMSDAGVFTAAASVGLAPLSSLDESATSEQTRSVLASLAQAVQRKQGISDREAVAALGKPTSISALYQRAATMGIDREMRVTALRRAGLDTDAFLETASDVPKRVNAFREALVDTMHAQLAKEQVDNLMSRSSPSALLSGAEALGISKDTRRQAMVDSGFMAKSEVDLRGIATEEQRAALTSGLMRSYQENVARDALIAADGGVRPNLDQASVQAIWSAARELQNESEAKGLDVAPSPSASGPRVAPPDLPPFESPSSAYPRSPGPSDESGVAVPVATTDGAPGSLEELLPPAPAQSAATDRAEGPWAPPLATTPTGGATGNPDDLQPIPGIGDGGAVSITPVDPILPLAAAAPVVRPVAASSPTRANGPGSWAAPSVGEAGGPSQEGLTPSVGEAPPTESAIGPPPRGQVAEQGPARDQQVLPQVAEQPMRTTPNGGEVPSVAHEARPTGRSESAVSATGGAVPRPAGLEPEPTADGSGAPAAPLSGQPVVGLPAPGAEPSPTPADWNGWGAPAAPPADPNATERVIERVIERVEVRETASVAPVASKAIGRSADAAGLGALEQSFRRSLEDLSAGLDRLAESVSRSRLTAPQAQRQVGPSSPASAISDELLAGALVKALGATETILRGASRGAGAVASRQASVSRPPSRRQAGFLSQLASMAEGYVARRRTRRYGR